MPKIAAENIEEHVRRQTGRILDVATELFTTSGYRATDLGAIARNMGLARNSLYRYFQSKDHILVAVMQREMMPYVERTRSLAIEYRDPAERIEAWLGLQMELATGPCHAMIRMLGDIDQASDETRAQIRILHEAPRDVLEQAVSELLADTERDPKLVSAMIASMVESAAGVAMCSGDIGSVMPELEESVRGVLERQS